MPWLSTKLRIDFSKLIITQGILPLAPGISGSSPKEGKLLFRWTDDSGVGKSRADDQVFVAIYSRQAKKWVFNINAGKRSRGYCIIDLKWFNGKRLQTYIGFVSADGIWVSDSLLCGGGECVLRSIDKRATEEWPFKDLKTKVIYFFFDF